MDKPPSKPKKVGLTAGYPQHTKSKQPNRIRITTWGCQIIRYIVSLAFLALLTGCGAAPISPEPAGKSPIPEASDQSQNPQPSVDYPSPEPAVGKVAPEAKKLSIFHGGCANLANGTLSHSHLKIYRLILEDICRDFKMDYKLVEVIASERVNKDGVNLYVENNVFGLSYWNRYVKGGLPPLKMILLMEDEKSWWADQLKGEVTVKPVWFGPSAEAGHCYAAEAEAFCPKGYYAMDKEVTGTSNILTTMIGSKLQWTTFRKVVPIHEATHQFHSVTGLGHWRFWYIEGQATYFELASSVLVSGLGASNWRVEQARLAATQDEIKFKAKTAEQAYAHLQKCDSHIDCQGLRYFGSSLAHELLVNTYGVDTYFAWNLALAERLPDFVWREMSTKEEAMREGIEGFESIFEEFFGTDLDSWERTKFAPYLLATYQCEVIGTKCS